MRGSIWLKLLGLAMVVSTGASSLFAADRWGLEVGNPQIRSAGPLAFGPEGILFVGDPKSAAVVAIQTEDRGQGAAEAAYDVPDVTARIAEALDTKAGAITINDMAVNPDSGHAFLSLSVARGETAAAALVRITPAGEINPIRLEKVAHAKVSLPDAPEDAVVGEGRRRGNRRDESITDLTYTDGRVLVAGLARGESPSSVREFQFPFGTNPHSASVEIFHAAHGRVEDNAAIRTFVPFTVDGQPSLLAGYTCTPLVRFSLDHLGAGEKVRGTTVAELGNRNRPLDMIVYERDGKEYLLMSNSSRGVMKIDTEDIEREQGLTEPVRGGGTAGQPYETIEGWDDIAQLDRLNDTQALVLAAPADGPQTLRSVELP